MPPMTSRTAARNAPAGGHRAFSGAFAPKRERPMPHPCTDALTPEKPHLSQFRIITVARCSPLRLNIRSFGAKSAANTISLSNKYLQRNVKKSRETESLFRDPYRMA
jgi:hypothetical protein